MVEPKFVLDKLVQDSRVGAVEGKYGTAVEVKEGEVDIGAGEMRVDRPLGRFTDADRKGDVRRLDRALARTLYLVVKRKEGGWGFPSGELVGSWWGVGGEGEFASGVFLLISLNEIWRGLS
jgi:large subunit ribosomal protein L46